MKQLFLILCAALVVFPAAARGAAPASYKQITQDEAKRMMLRDDGHVILDVRRRDEYDAGHIPGAILIPNEEIGAERPDALPDLDQVILIYCRSGRRSMEAAQKLADMGYTNLYEFGGILTWTGEIVRGTPATLALSSFDGGGPEFTVVLEDAALVAWTSERAYDDPDHDEMTGAGYDVVFTFTGLKAGNTRLTIQARSPIADNYDAHYLVTVDAGLNVTLAPVEAPDPTPKATSGGLLGLLSSLLGGKHEMIVGMDIEKQDVLEFWYTYSRLETPAFYQRYRFYLEDEAPWLFHETRERDDYGPLTEADVTRSGQIALTEAQWDTLWSCLFDGAVTRRADAAESGDAGPWLYLYWAGDEGAWQQFSFASWQQREAFEAFCEALTAAR